jgi:hypothetical protein
MDTICHAMNLQSETQNTLQYEDLSLKLSDGYISSVKLTTSSKQNAYLVVAYPICLQ